ncbi:MAG: hypothetical protein R3208_09435 [Ketobacteraceae bacterium]|nr:hypothetical protein [Ketobacteraceae bacterium]
MIIADELISPWFAGGVTLLSLVLLAVAAYTAPWRALMLKAERQHALFAAWVSLVLMMKLQIHWVDGISLHFLVMTTLVVIFGWSLSLMIGAAAQLLLCLWEGNPGWGISVNFFLATVVPATISYGILRFIIRHKSNNLFLFLLGGGFFGSILTLLGTLVILAAVVALNGRWDTLADMADSALMVVLLSYSEGFINGLLVTAVTVFFPGIVKTFDEKKYLDS